MQKDTATSKQTTNSAPKRYVFVLLDNFTLLCFSAAVESLRIANRMAGEPLYDWVLAGEGGDTVSCSAGASFKVDMDLEDLRRDDVVMLCGGINVQAATTKRVLNWLPGAARGRALYGSVYGGQSRSAGWQARHDPLGKP